MMRHLFGYLAGFAVFLVGIPFCLYVAATNLDPYVPFRPLPNAPVRLGIASLVGAAGLVFIVWSNLCLFFVGRGGPADCFGVQISPRTRHLVTTGPYRYTRNPMGFGALSLYLALGLFLDSPACLGFVITLFLLAPVYLIRVEEKRLSKDFGQSFDQYRRSVPLLLPRPLKKRL